MVEYIHSVELDRSKCIGCTDCIKRCPTEAIRVRDGKAVITDQKCIDCGLCIKVCTHKAKKATTQPMSIINNYKYKVAIPAPTIYSQFKNITDVNIILTGIKQLGFDDVFEVSMAAQAVTEATIKMIEEKQLKKPIISSACPAIIRLIMMRFPSLIENILPVISPFEAAAIAAKDYLVSQGMKREDIGVFFISPCAAKHSYIVNPIGVQRSEVDGVISMQEIYMALRVKIKQIKNPEKLVQSGSKGVDWALSGGESKGVNIDNAIAVDGVENVIQILEEIEDGQLEDVDFIEGLACIGGCVGGPLTVVNSFVSKNALGKIKKDLSKMTDDQRREKILNFDDINFEFTKELKPVASLLLHENREIALQKIESIREIVKRLPSIDCGSCGSPTCEALAEDITSGNAQEVDCVFMLRKRVKVLAETMVDIAAKMPQTFSAYDKGDEPNDC